VDGKFGELIQTMSGLLTVVVKVSVAVEVGEGVVRCLILGILVLEIV